MYAFLLTTDCRKPTKPPGRLQARAAGLALLICFSCVTGVSAGKIALLEPVKIITATGAYTFQTEIADNPEARRVGLMYRKSMQRNHAMLFILNPPRRPNMWMRNTYIALDMIFLDHHGTVTYIARNTTPLSLKYIIPPKPVSGVLEVVAGTAKRISLKPGDRLKHRKFR